MVKVKIRVLEIKYQLGIIKMRGLLIEFTIPNLDLICIWIKEIFKISFLTRFLSTKKHSEFVCLSCKIHKVFFKVKKILSNVGFKAFWYKNDIFACITKNLSKILSFSY